MLPEAVTKALGIESTDSWKKGDPFRVAKGHFKQNGWEVSSGLSRSVDLETHVNALLKKISRVKKNFVRFCKRYPGTLCCVVYSYDGDRPALAFGRQVIRILTDLNSEIDIDLYILDDD